MKSKCEQKCEWKTWHDQRLRMWRSIRDRLCYVLAWVGLCLALFSIGYFCCWWRNDVARLEREASLLPSTQQQVMDLRERVWDLQIRLGDIKSDTLIVRSRPFVLITAPAIAE